MRLSGRIRLGHTVPMGVWMVHWLHECTVWRTRCSGESIQGVTRYMGIFVLRCVDDHPSLRWASDTMGDQLSIRVPAVRPMDLCTSCLWHCALCSMLGQLSHLLPPHAPSVRRGPVLSGGLSWRIEQQKKLIQTSSDLWNPTPSSFHT